VKKIKPKSVNQDISLDDSMVEKSSAKEEYQDDHQEGHPAKGLSRLGTQEPRECMVE